jgi:acetylornithine deacetylase/succinyl-diaminopimelate desuccinylase-like protein
VASVLALPQPRGEISEALLAELTRPVHPLVTPALATPADPLSDEDLQLALYCCYELHYRGLPGVADEWVPVDDLLDCAKLYALAAMRFCGVAAG